MKAYKKTAALAAILLILTALAGFSARAEEGKISVRVLILPKFEVGGMTGDFPGEAQYFYEEYLEGGEVYPIPGGTEETKVWYKDGIALCLLGQGKVNAAINTSAVLSDERFDLSEAYVLCVGCGGAAAGYGIFGDVFVITSAVDMDLGYWADGRELGDKTGTTWFHDESWDDTAVVRLDESLTERAYGRIKDLMPETTGNTVRYLQKEYPGEDWADRPPKVLKGTSLTSDRYWKGRYDHRNALAAAEIYGCPDPFAVTEMEDIASAQAVKCHGMLDRLIILRAAVNMDVFPEGMTPEKLWGPGVDDHIASEDSLESVDIFETAMHNCFEAGKVLIEAILEGML